MSKLKTLLFDEYGGLREGRIHKSDQKLNVIIDDRSAEDTNASGELVPWFFQMTISVDADDLVTFKLLGGIPISFSFREWAELHDVEIVGSEPCQLRFAILPGRQSFLDELSSQISRIPQKFRRFPYYYLRHQCPRASSNIVRLRDVLNQAWG